MSGRNYLSNWTHLEVTGVPACRSKATQACSSACRTGVGWRGLVACAALAVRSANVQISSRRRCGEPQRLAEAAHIPANGDGFRLTETARFLRGSLVLRSVSAINPGELPISHRRHDRLATSLSPCQAAKLRQEEPRNAERRGPKDKPPENIQRRSQWEHVVALEAVYDADLATLYPRFVDGARRRPPEDAGGPPGYEHYLAAMADRRHPDRREILAWRGGPYNPEKIDLALLHFRRAGIVQGRETGKAAFEKSKMLHRSRSRQGAVTGS